MTIKDIAKLSGYGIGTVSRVLNNHSDVSDKARKKIMEVIEESNFQPNTNARHLKRQSVSSLSIIVKGNQNMLFADILEKMQMLFSRNGENAEVSYIDEDANEVECALSLCRDRNPKGIIFLGGNLDYFDAFDSIEVPCVLLTNSAGSLNISNLSSFYTDDEEASYQVGSYLIKQGHKKIGVITGKADSLHAQARLIGYQKALRDEGLLYDPELIYYGDWGRESGHTGAEVLLKKQVTAIFCMNDLMAGGCYDWADESGIKIPQEISVAGYDNRELSSYYKPPLSTTELPLHDIGYRAAEVMIGLVEKKSGETAEPQVYKVPCKQLIRQSIKTL